MCWRLIFTAAAPPSRRRPDPPHEAVGRNTGGGGRHAARRAAAVAGATQRRESVVRVRVLLAEPDIFDDGPAIRGLCLRRWRPDPRTRRLESGTAGGLAAVGRRLREH